MNRYTVLRRAVPVGVAVGLSLMPPSVAAASGRPDLHTTALAITPAAVAPGETLVAEDTVANLGKRKAKPSTTAYLLSAESGSDAGDHRLGTRQVHKLKPRKRDTGGASFILPASTSPGSYHVLACADAERVVAEKKEGNNCSVSAAIEVSPSGVARDSDGDGVVDAVDCAPSDPAINPRAVDEPDLDFVDANCDGIDGDAARAVFVTPSGSDASPGTPAAPRRTLAAAIDLAANFSPVHDVYVATGLYADGTVALASGVGIYGGYSAVDWSRSLSPSTRIQGAPAIAASGVADGTLQLLTIEGTLHGGGLSVYGLKAIDSNLLLATVAVQTPDAGDGTAGVAQGPAALSGTDGDPGNPGAENSGGLGCDTAALPTGGPGGPSPFGRSGGKGGDAGLGPNAGVNGDDAPGAGLPGGLGVGGLGGPSSTPSDPASVRGHDGAAGTGGVPGSAGGASFVPSGYAPSDGADGGRGADGFGGGGGGGGGGGTTACDSYGSSGGGGGSGGAGGVGGGGGQSGGSSVALYLWASNVIVDGATLTLGDGGDGGAAGAGQGGGVGGHGGAGGSYGGADEQDDGSNGGAGGDGGDGGQGGPGGGGAGGSSIGVLLGGGAIAQFANVSFTLGDSGQGGSSPGNAGSPGEAASLKTVP
jgi:hypothetical protein